MTSSLSAKVDSRPSEVIPTFRVLIDHEFYEYILNDIPDLDLQLFNLINSLGIENVDQWEDAYVQSMPSRWNVEAQFVEQLMDDLGYLSWNGPNEGPLPDFILSHIDWQAVWDSELRHDYSTIEYDGVTHFFSRNF
jgi:hypothetical protein